MACDIESVNTILDATYGEKSWQSHGDPLGELVGTVLSQHTSDANTARAYRSLRQRFPRWADARDAPTAAVADAIRSGGLAEVKAPRIQRILRDLTGTDGEPALPDLAAVPLANAKSALTVLPGVGPKTAACVLLFALGLPALPVDTHVHRVALRLGLIPPGTNAEAAHGLLESQIGTNRDRVYAFHLNVIAHGRAVCIARSPRCGVCPLRECCDFYAATVAHEPGAPGTAPPPAP